MKSKVFYLTVLVALLLFSGSASARPLDAAHTQIAATGGFTNASFQGNYALTGFVGANVAAIVGTCHFDGSGHFNCTYTGNVPGENATRLIFPITDEGEYTINADGTGTIHEFETVDGVTSEYNHNIVILDAEAIGPYVVATELFGLVDQTDPSGSLFTSHYDRLPDVVMTPATEEEANKQSMRHWMDAINSHDLSKIDAAVDKYYAKDYVLHNPTVPNFADGAATVKLLIRESMEALPDFHISLEDVVAEGDMVAFRVVVSGTEPTDQALSFWGMHLVRFVDGQIAEEWQLSEPSGAEVVGSDTGTE